MVLHVIMQISYILHAVACYNVDLKDSSCCCMYSACCGMLIHVFCMLWYVDACNNVDLMYSLAVACNNVGFAALQFFC